MEGTTARLIILQGPPAVGKSTKALELQAMNPERTVIVSRDGLRHARGQYWIPAQEKFIEELEHDMICKALDYGYTVLVDATNLNPNVIAKFQNLGSIYGVSVEGWLFHEERMVCLARDANPDRVHHVGANVINQFYTKYRAYCHQHNIGMVPGTITRHTLYEHYGHNDN